MTTTPAPEAAPLAPLAPLAQVRASVASVRGALAALPTGDLPDDGGPVERLIEDVVAAERQLAELRLRLARVAEARDEAAKVAASGTDAWLAHLTGTSRAVMAGGLWLASVLSEKYDAVRVAFARGDLSEAQVRVIVRAGQKIPATVSDADRDTCVADLVARAVEQRLEPGRLRRVARRMLDKLDPAVADRHQAALLEAEEHRARVETFLSMQERGDGWWEGTFALPELHAQLLRTALAHLTAPRRLTQDRAGVLITDESAYEALGYTERQGRALCELIEHLPRDGWTTGPRLATVMVHLDYDHLVDGLAAAHLDTGDDISATQARRLACDTGLIPAVFGTAALPLDLGRERRLFTPAQRAALSAVHDTCAAEGCRRPYAWTELHHVDWWSHGGPTDLDNALPLCGWHHHRIHDSDYSHTRLASGEVRFRRRRRGPAPPRVEAAA